MCLTQAVIFLRGLMAFILWSVGYIGFIRCEPGDHASRNTRVRPLHTLITN